MKALRASSGKAAVENIPIPNIPGETLVRVISSGICNTDLEIIKGYAAFSGTLGHEFVGVVEDSSDDPALVGLRVVGEINAGCGSCPLCLAGDPRHCPTRTVLGIKGRDGSHAEYLSLPSRNLIPVPDNVTNDQAVFAEPLAAAIGITEQVEITPDTRVVVIGDGKLGQLCARALVSLTNHASLVGKHSSKLKLAEDHGIETFTAEKAGQLSGRFDVVVEASGSESGFASALDLVRPRGKIVLKSTFHGRPSWEAWRVVVDEITVVGSRCGRIGPALEYLAEGKIKVDDLIEDKFSLANALTAIDRAASRGTMKVLLGIDS
ncbi:MAG: alcohol dehydrogenase catalytic domain-containing protein [Acidobacteria bacterium]|nr:alcohol dehydrogenase catalytic domain-containing protein [Acidobacteriota bacterium]